MNYQDWLIAVDFELTSHFRGASVADLDDAALANAFASGQTPAAFAMRNPLPTKLRPGAPPAAAGPTAIAAVPSRLPWTVAGVCVLLALGLSAMAICLGLQNVGLRREIAKRDEELSQMRTDVGRARVALKESEGARVASGAQASVEQATDLANRSLDRSEAIADTEALRREYNDLADRFNALLDRDGSLVDDYNSLEMRYNMLVDEYNMLLMSH